MHAARILVSLLILSTGCATMGLPDPPVEDVAKKRKQRTEDAVRDFERKRNFAEFQAAKSQYERHDAKGCRATLQRLLQREPGHVDARLMLAELHLAENQPQEALIQVEQVLNDHPDNARARHTAGLLFDTTGQTGRALAYYGRAAELEPNNELYAISYQMARGDAAGVPTTHAALPPSIPHNAQIPISAATTPPRRTRPGQAAKLPRP